MEEINEPEEGNKEEDNEGHHLSKFLHDLRLTQLSCRSPTQLNKYPNNHYNWVFWEVDEQGQMGMIQHHIRAALLDLSCPELEDSLIQFWRAEMIGGRIYLTTSHQPFALHNLTTVDLTRYVKHCLGYKIAVVMDDNNDDIVDADLRIPITGGPIWRSFLNQLPEASPNVKLYSDKEFSLCQVALDCGIKQIVALPVLLPYGYGQGCVGVLELLLTKDRSPPLNTYISDVGKLLERFGLETIDTYTNKYDQESGMGKGGVTEEITKALRQVCKTLRLPVACIWARYKHESSSNGSSIPRETLVSVWRLPFQCDYMSYDHCRASYSLPFNEGKGLVGKAFLSDKPCMCRDVTQLSIIDYPMAHFSHKSRLKGCFAICLQSIATGNRDYVLEFFLSRGSTFMGDVQELLLSVLAILKHQLTSFEAISGEPAARNDSFAEIDKFSFDDNSESFETVPAFSTELIDSRALETNHGEVLRSNSYDPQREKEDSINNETDAVCLIQSETAITQVVKQCAMKRSVVDNEPKENLWSRDELLQHRGKRLEDVAEIFQVSRSTFKRRCRKHDINRWPSSKRRKNSSLPHDIRNQMDIGVTGCNVEPISKTVSRDPSYSNKSLKPTDQTMSSVTDLPCSRPPTNLAQTQCTSTEIKDPYTCSRPLPTNSAPTQGTGTVTVKVTHMNRIIRFDLSCSSRLPDLVEEVASRLNLQDGTFSFIYVDEDGDKISITKDADLWYCMKLLNYSTIRLLIDD